MWNLLLFSFPTHAPFQQEKFLFYIKISRHELGSTRLYVGMEGDRLYDNGTCHKLRQWRLVFIVAYIESIAGIVRSPKSGKLTCNYTHAHQKNHNSKLLCCYILIIIMWSTKNDSPTATSLSLWMESPRPLQSSWNDSGCLRTIITLFIKI